MNLPRSVGRGCGRAAVPLTNPASVGRGSCRAAVTSTKARLAGRLALPGSWNPTTRRVTCWLLFTGCVLGLSMFRALAAAPPAGNSLVTYQGMCDASAGVALNDEWFVVANDEDNVLRLYSRLAPGGPQATLKLARFLRLTRGKRETDLEGGAWLGDRIYWITSHGCDAAGQPAANRRRFFATSVRWAGTTPALQFVGTPCSTLLEQLAADLRLAPFGLAAAATHAPKDPGALNIEGLCATPDGHLLIGFRNPVPHGQALLVPLLNPAEVVAGAPARFSDPLQLDLGGLGIRDLLWLNHRYLLIAGAYHGGGEMRLYEWAGDVTPARWIPSADFGDTTPEALLVFPGDAAADRLTLLSDDGTRLIGCTECKRLKSARLRQFRALSLTP